MLRVMRRSRLAGLAGLASIVFAAVVVCPCLPLGPPATSSRAHECCPSETGIGAAASSCCASDAGAPRVSTPVPAGSSPTAPPATAVFESDGLAPRALASVVSPVFGRPPLILRI
jgi:hypothetical protein